MQNEKGGDMANNEEKILAIGEPIILYVGHKAYEVSKFVSNPDSSLQFDSAAELINTLRIL